MSTRLVVAVGVVALLSASHPIAQRKAVQVGYCTPLRNLDAAKTAGFDYVELSTTEIASLSDADFDQAAARVRQVGLPVPATNLFLPATLKVTGPGNRSRRSRWRYVKKAFDRLAKLGTQIVVFGSGGARQVPDGFPKDEAFQQLVDFGRRIAPEARARGITVTIEPLRRQETNIINSAAEGLELVKAINDPNFQLMVDFYHLASEQEDPSIVHARERAHPPPAHGEPDRPRVSAEVGRVRLRAVLRHRSRRSATTSGSASRRRRRTSRPTRRWRSRCCGERSSSLVIRDIMAAAAMRCPAADLHVRATTRHGGRKESAISV